MNGGAWILVAFFATCAAGNFYWVDRPRPTMTLGAAFVSAAINGLLMACVIWAAS